jgi:hypothetical protein
MPLQSSEILQQRKTQGNKEMSAHESQEAQKKGQRAKREEISPHKPIIHRKCGRRIPDAGEIVIKGKSVKHDDLVCRCINSFDSLFDSSSYRPDLEWYDKHDR